MRVNVEDALHASSLGLQVVCNKLCQSYVYEFTKQNIKADRYVNVRGSRICLVFTASIYTIHANVCMHSELIASNMVQMEGCLGKNHVTIYLMHSL